MRRIRQLTFSTCTSCISPLSFRKRNLAKILFSKISHFKIFLKKVGYVRTLLASSLTKKMRSKGRKKREAFVCVCVCTEKGTRISRVFFKNTIFQRVSQYCFFTLERNLFMHVLSPHPMRTTAMHSKTLESACYCTLSPSVRQEVVAS